MRAQDLLWGTTERKARWKDMEERAICNVRWPWLPPKGLDDVKRIAISVGEWRDSGDGYVEKGPFPKAKTSVKLVTRGCNEETGIATIELTAVDAGANARIHVSTKSDVSAASPTISDSIIERDDTVLWFLAVDPDGKHETGDPAKWTNTLTLTHEPKDVMGKRTVSLTVKPRGTIRWNVEGTNPREGQIYSKPIAIDGDEEVKIYAYAEDAGVEIAKTFTIRAAAEGTITIDLERPAIIKKRQKIATTKDVFFTLKALKEARGALKGSLSATVGQGDVNATTRFGPQTSLDSKAMEAFLTAARQTISEEAAEVEIGFSEVHFETGRAMEEFVAAVNWTVNPEEVEQQ
jgi:hypothetical protein